MKKSLKRIKPTGTKKLNYPSFKKSIDTILNETGKSKLTIFVDSVSRLSATAAKVGQETFYLVFAPTDDAGNVDKTNTVSLELPCPPFCVKGDKVTVEVD